MNKMGHNITLATFFLMMLLGALIFRCFQLAFYWISRNF